MKTIQELIEAGDHAKLTQNLTADALLANKPLVNGDSPLDYTLTQNQLPCALTLLAHGAELARNRNQTPPQNYSSFIISHCGQDPDIDLNVLYWIVVNVEDNSDTIFSNLLKTIQEEKFQPALQSLYQLSLNLGKNQLATQLKNALPILSPDNGASAKKTSPDFLHLFASTNLPLDEKNALFLELLNKGDTQIMHFILINNLLTLNEIATHLNKVMSPLQLIQLQNKLKKHHILCDLNPEKAQPAGLNTLPKNVFGLILEKLSYSDAEKLDSTSAVISGKVNDLIKKPKLKSKKTLNEKRKTAQDELEQYKMLLKLYEQLNKTSTHKQDLLRNYGLERHQGRHLNDDEKFLVFSLLQFSLFLFGGIGAYLGTFALASIPVSILVGCIPLIILAVYLIEAFIIAPLIHYAVDTYTNRTLTALENSLKSTLDNQIQTVNHLTQNSTILIERPPLSTENRSINVCQNYITSYESEISKMTRELQQITRENNSVKAQPVALKKEVHEKSSFEVQTFFKKNSPLNPIEEKSADDSLSPNQPSNQV